MKVFNLVKNVLVSLNNDVYGMTVYAKCLFADSAEEEDAIKERYTKLILDYKANFSNSEVVNLKKFGDLDVEDCTCIDVEGSRDFPVYLIQTSKGILIFIPFNKKPSVHKYTQDTIRIEYTKSTMTLAKLKTLIESTSSEFKNSCDLG